MKLELKHLAPYLPYELKMIRNGFKGKLISIKNDYESIAENFEFQVSCSNWWENTNDLNHYKPILRPISDIEKQINVNGENFIPIEWLEEKYYTLELHKQCLRLLEEDGENWTNNLEYILINHLFEWHFDVFGLIKNSVAIDFNTLTE